MSLLLDRLHRAARRARVPRHRCALAGLLLLLATTFWPALASAQSADLQVSQHDVSPDPVGRGASSDFTIRITNNGPAAANGAVVTITVAPRYEVLNQPGTSFPATCTLSGVVGAQQLRADFRQHGPRSFRRGGHSHEEGRGLPPGVPWIAHMST
jgi:hypothetical protein